MEKKDNRGSQLGVKRGPYKKMGRPLGAKHKKTLIREAKEFGMIQAHRKVFMVDKADEVL